MKFLYKIKKFFWDGSYPNVSVGHVHKKKVIEETTGLFDDDVPKD